MLRAACCFCFGAVLCSTHPTLEVPLQVPRTAYRFSPPASWENSGSLPRATHAQARPDRRVFLITEDTAPSQG